MPMIRVLNWDNFQHFKDRDPIWIKLYRELRNKREWRVLSGGAAKFLVDIWLISSEQHPPGEVPDLVDLPWEVRASKTEVDGWLQELEAQGFIRTITERYHADIPRALAREEKEKRREEKRENAHATSETAAGEMRGWLGEYVGCVNGATDYTLHSLWGLYGPDGTETHIWKGLAEERQPPVFATAMLRYTGEGNDKYKARYFRAFLATAVDDAIASDRARAEAKREASGTNELREAAKALEAQEIARLQAEAAPKAVGIPSSTTRGGGPQRIQIPVDPA